jgi:alpha-glucosidase/oligosaccharide 4-alpha-D-glucosyltransferase
MKSIIIRIVAVLFAFCFSLNLIGQYIERQLEKFENSDSKISLYVNDGIFEIVPFNGKIVHTSFFPKDYKVKNFSFAVETKPTAQNYKLEDDANQISIILEDLIIKINKHPFTISYHNKEGELLITDKHQFAENMMFAPMDFSISDDEILYGAGARVLGMNRRGNKLQLYNRAHYGYETHSELMNYTLPLFISSKKYAVLFDNASAGFLDLDSKKNNQITYESKSGIRNYYIITGNDWYDLTNQYTWLTGRQPIPPRWAFGNFSSRFGYHSQKEVEATVNRFDKDKIPLDAVIIDIYWFGKEIKGDMGNLDWYRDSFPHPEKMIKMLENKGIKTILVTEPFILTTSKKWTEVADKKLVGLDSTGNPFKFDFYFGNTGLIDLYKPEARAWFWNIYKNLTKQGIAGWWGDLGEPEVHPSDLHHLIGGADEVHNAYGHEWAKLIFEGYQKDFPEKRPFILMRSGYAGSQRYGMIPWTGDVSRSWGGLFSQPEISLQMGMQGIAYMHSDLGGFAGGEIFDPELYTRWLQYGVFQPILRPHAQEHIPAEPVFHDKNTKDLARKAIELRYKLIPYIYNMAFENSQTGKPLMIPLFFNEMDNKELLIYDQSYIWGDAFLVTPVKEKGKKTQTIYFPKGYNWFDFFGNTQFKGGQSSEIPLTIEHIPVFVKGGSFIPMTLNAENTEKYSLNKFELHYYADSMIENSNYQLYNDDGKTPDAFTKQKYEMMFFKANNTKEKLTISSVKDAFSDNLKHENLINLKVHHLRTKPREIRINNRILDPKDWKWKEDLKLLELKMNCKVKKEIIEIIK